MYDAVRVIMDEFILDTPTGEFRLTVLNDGNDRVFVMDEYDDALVYDSSSFLDTIRTWLWLTRQTEIDTTELLAKGFVYVD